MPVNTLPFRLSEPFERGGIEKFEELLNQQIISSFLYEPDELSKKNLRKYKIRNKTFENVSFSHTALLGLNFQNCKFNNCLFLDAKIDHCEFHKCEFIRTNTYKFCVTNSYIDPRAFLKSAISRGAENIGVDMFHELMRNSRSMDQPEFESDAAYLFRKWKRFQNRYEFSKLETSFWKRAELGFSILGNWLWEVLFGYGVRFRNFVLTAIGIVLLFSSVNFFLKDFFGLTGNGKVIDSFWDAFYYTLITMTTVGYGDIVPEEEFGRLFMAFEGLVGFGLFAVFASIVFRKIAP